MDLIGLCACGGYPELNAPLPATPARDLYPSACKCIDFADLCACAGDPELDAPLPATITRDVTYIPLRGNALILLIFAHAQVILNSMHRYQPRLHVIYIPPRSTY